MKIISIDHGDKNIGIALADEKQKVAVPFLVIKNNDAKSSIKKIKEIVKEEGVGKIVVGMPLSISGQGLRPVDEKNEQMKKVFEFIKELKKKIKLPLVLEDERMSSKMADKLNKGKGRKKENDDIAAMLILQAYLDRRT